MVFWHEPTQSWGANGRHPDGARWRRYGFVTEGDADAWVFQTLAPKDELGRLATELPAPILRDVAHALSIRTQKGLARYDEGLFTRLIKEDIARNPLGQKKTFREVVEAWLSSKEGKKARTVRDAKDCTALAVKMLGEKLVALIVKTDIEKVLGRFKGYRRRNIHVRLREVFKYCQENRYIGTAPEDNPCYGIQKTKITRSLPNPVTFEDARRLFALAVQTEDSLGCTAWVAFRMFLALRDSEALKLTYDQKDGINASRGFAHLNRNVAKLRERTVYLDAAQCPDPELRAFIPSNLRRIMADLPRLEAGMLAPSRRNIDRFKAYARHCGIVWGRNGLRAGFATHHFALFKDAKAASKIMGHLPADGGVDVFYKHYYRFADYEAGKAYFDIGRKGLKKAASVFAPPVTYLEFVSKKGRPI